MSGPGPPVCPDTLAVRFLDAHGEQDSFSVPCNNVLDPVPGKPWMLVCPNGHTSHVAHTGNSDCGCLACLPRGETTCSS